MTSSAPAQQSLTVSYDDRFEIEIEDGARLRYRSDSCSASFGVTMSESTLTIDLDDYSSLRAEAADGASEGLILSRTIAAARTLDLNIVLNRVPDADPVELLSLLLELSPPSTLEFLRLLDAVHDGAPGVIDTREVGLTIMGGESAEVTGKGIDVMSVGVLRLPVGLDAALDAIAAVAGDIVAAPAAGSIRWDGEGRAHVSALGPPHGDVADVVGPLVAVAEVVSVDESWGCLALMGEDTAAVVVKTASAEFVAPIGLEDALGGLAQAVWGDGTRSAGPCTLQIRTAEQIYAGTDEIDDAEAALKWFVEVFASMETGDSDS